MVSTHTSSLPNSGQLSNAHEGTNSLHPSPSASVALGSLHSGEQFSLAWQNGLGETPLSYTLVLPLCYLMLPHETQGSGSQEGLFYKDLPLVHPKV